MEEKPIYERKDKSIQDDAKLKKRELDHISRRDEAFLKEKVLSRSNKGKFQFQFIMFVHHLQRHAER